LILGKIQVDLGSRVIVIDNCVKSHVKVIADLSNKWIRLLENNKNNKSMKTNIDEFSQTQELINLSRLQIENQEKIIFLLERIANNNVS
jgi:hypothetical protein